LQDSIKAENAIAVYRAMVAKSFAHWLCAIKQKAFGQSIACKGAKKSANQIAHSLLWFSSYLIYEA
tara:strand:- start:85 stop:282 length:198 start_codon:yes stop_codon:yes gene_type:complete